MSSAPAWLGPVVRSYRITPAVYDLVLLSAVPLALLVGAVVFGDRDELPILLVATALVGLVAFGWIAWSLSSFLHLHAHGVRVGRHLGTVRAIPFGSIDPASIATYTDISSAIGMRRMVPSRWHVFPASSAAVSLVGPSPTTEGGPGYVPPPVPGDGFVVFASSRAPEIDAELRRALVAHGVPAELAWWSGRQGPFPLSGLAVAARCSMPGYLPTWRP